MGSVIPDALIVYAVKYEQNGIISDLYSEKYG